MTVTVTLLAVVVLLTVVTLHLVNRVTRVDAERIGAERAVQQLKDHLLTTVKLQNAELERYEQRHLRELERMRVEHGKEIERLQSVWQTQYAEQYRATIIHPKPDAEQRLLDAVAKDEAETFKRALANGIEAVKRDAAAAGTPITHEEAELVARGMLQVAFGAGGGVGM